MLWQSFASIFFFLFRGFFCIILFLFFVMVFKILKTKCENLFVSVNGFQKKNLATYFQTFTNQKIKVRQHYHCTFRKAPGCSDWARIKSTKMPILDLGPGTRFRFRLFTSWIKHKSSTWELQWAVVVIRWGQDVGR